MNVENTQNLQKISPFVSGFLIGIGAMLAYFAAVGHPVWGENDDVGMSMATSGVWMSLQPSADLFFIHPFYGWILSHLYKWQPELPWYGIFFILVVALSLVTLNYSILRLRRQPGLFLITICATFVTVLPSLWNLQFTIVAGLSAAAGAALSLSLIIKEHESIKSLIPQVSVSLSLLLTGAMIRFDSMLMVGALFAPYAAVLFFKSARSIQNNRLRRLYIVKYVIIGIVASVSVVGLQSLKHRYYSDEPEWTKWFSLNKAKSEFIDSQKIKYNEQTRAVFDSVKWSRTDYNMIISWQYVDPVQYAPEKFISVINALQKQTLKNIMPQNGFRPWKSALAKIIKDTKIIILERAAGILFCILTAGLLMIRWRRVDFLYAASIACAAIAVLLYIYLEKNRSPFRVLILLWICVLWMTLLVAASSSGLPTTYRHWKAYKAGVIILTSLLLASMRENFIDARKRVKKRVAAQISLESRIRAWSVNLPRDSIIYNIGGSFPYKYHLPLNSFSYLRSIKGFIGTGWNNQSPQQLQIINTLGLSDNFYWLLAQKENVYVVKANTPIQKELEILRNHYNEVYGLELSFIDEPNLPYLYKMVFKKQNKENKK